MAVQLDSNGPHEKKVFRGIKSNVMCGSWSQSTPTELSRLLLAFNDHFKYLEAYQLELFFSHDKIVPAGLSASFNTSRMDPVRFVEKTSMFRLICCERKILFWLKNKLKKTNYKINEHGLLVTVPLAILLSVPLQ